MDIMCWLHICLLIAHSYKNYTHNEKLNSNNLEVLFFPFCTSKSEQIT